MIVTIDGPAGSGKSTVARALADRLGFRFLDTGAMYRAVAWALIQRRLELADPGAAGQVARETQIRFDNSTVWCDGVDVTREIRSAEVSHGASLVAMHPTVRGEMVRLQRAAAAGANIVTEGRDQGTVVFPEAECKFFLTATLEERAARRQKQLDPTGSIAAQELEQIIAEMRARDSRDEGRDVAPLCPANDATLIDTSLLPTNEVIDQMEKLVRERMKLKVISDG